MATYKILYWQEIPTQIRVEDDSDTVTAMLDGRFMALVDAQAMKEGLTETDAFLDAWHWSEEEERDGSAHEVAAALKAELEAGKR
ncbi:MAG: virulence factor [Terracidiphilus sp.]